MRSSLEALLEYLVVKALANKFEIIKALADYFVNNKSPSTVASEYGLSKHQVRGYIQRIVEKAGSVNKARTIMKFIAPYVLKIKPIMKKSSDTIVQCILCGEELPLIAAEEHVKKYHGGLVDEYVDAIIELLRRDLEKHRKDRVVVDTSQSSI